MRKFWHVFLSLVIVYATTTGAYASAVGTSPGGWSAVDVAVSGAQATIDAVKKSGGKALKSAVTLAPNAGKVGKVLLRGGLVGALAMAVPQIIGEGVDWVLDPENNAIRYKDKSGVGDDATAGYSWRVDNFPKVPDKYPTPAALAAAIEVAACSGADLITCERTEFKRASVAQYHLSFKITRRGGVYTPFYNLDRVSDSSQTQTGSSSGYKSIPISQVAAKVISNAESGHAPSQEAVKAAALDGFAAGEHDAALDAAAVPDSNVDTDNPPATDTPQDKPFDDSGILAALKSIKDLLAGLLSSLGELTGFFNSDVPETKPEPVQVDSAPPTKAPTDFDVDYVNFGGQCPVMSPFSIDILGNSSSMTFDMTPLCDMAVKIRPAVIAIAYFIGLGVVASAIRET